MMKKTACSILFLLTAGLLLVMSAAAADQTDFSGSYTLTNVKGGSKPKKSDVWTLHVVQTGCTIEVTQVQHGHKNINKYALDGTVGPYTSPGGVAGKCRAQFRSKLLILESMMAGRTQPNAPTVQLHTKEEWDLSSDGKTLKIHFEVDSPGLPPGFQPFEPVTYIYTRD